MSLSVPVLIKATVTAEGPRSPTQDSDWKPPGGGRRVLEGFRSAVVSVTGNGHSKGQRSFRSTQHSLKSWGGGRLS